MVEVVVWVLLFAWMVVVLLETGVEAW